MEARCRRETSDEEQGQREKKKKRRSEVFFPPSTRAEKNPLQLKKKKKTAPLLALELFLSSRAILSFSLSAARLSAPPPKGQS
jgi:hypothetical protein